MKQPMTTNQAAEFIGRSPGSVRNLVIRRKIPFRKAGGRLHFFKEELLWWIDTAPGVTKEDIKKERNNER